MRDRSTATFADLVSGVTRSEILDAVRSAFGGTTPPSPPCWPPHRTPGTPGGDRGAGTAAPARAHRTADTRSSSRQHAGNPPLTSLMSTCRGSAALVGSRRHACTPPPATAGANVTRARAHARRHRRRGSDHGARYLGGLMGDAHGRLLAVAGTADPPAAIVHRRLDRVLRRPPDRLRPVARSRSTSSGSSCCIRPTRSRSGSSAARADTRIGCHTRTGARL